MKTLDINNIAILGTGTIGSSWASFFASKGMSVRMHDLDKSSQDRGVQKAKESLRVLEQYGLMDKSVLEHAMLNITAANDFGQLLEGAEYVQESVYENYEVKKSLFKQLGAISAPTTILASSSSGLLMSEIQGATKIPERCLIAHPFNPPHLIPLVELVPGRLTDLQLIEATKRFFEDLGKLPVVLKKEAPGHIANRLAAALWREAVNIVVQGIASVEDVDKALYAGPGIRWALMGEHLIYDLGGGEGGYGYLIDHIGKSFDAVWKDMATWTDIPDESKDMLVEGVKKSMGNRSFAEIVEWRDKKIVELVKVIYRETPK
ncbi:MAG: 3-hydroxyacyl-CoA dehydrogenase NAD-binding domain-containing protein [Desulfomonilaceae bacterium]